MAKKTEAAKPSATDGIRKNVAADSAVPQGRREVKGAGILKWEEGMEVNGAFLGLRSINTKFGPSELVEIGFADGTRATFGAPTILANLLRGVVYGAGITIRCLGKVATKTAGQEAWSFNVWADGVA
jgi:hypothetical protein